MPFAPLPRARFGWFVQACLGLGLPGVVTSGCGLDEDLVLRTTEPAAGGTSGSGGSVSTAGAAAVVPSPFCDFRWGRSWAGTSDQVQSSGDPPYPTGLGMMSIWVGYEDDNVLNTAIGTMLTALSPGGDATLQGVMPVFYGYFIPFKAENDGVLKACAPEAATDNICTAGAEWIRSNQASLEEVYVTYAKQIAAIWGISRPLIWLFEPGFNEYIRTSQTNPLSLEELGALASSLVRVIKAYLPNALVSHYGSSDISDFAQYFSYFDLSLVSMVNVTGNAQYEYFSSGNAAATYRNLHDATGLPIFVDTGFDYTEVTDSGWLTASIDVINARIADGVIAVQMDTGTSAMQTRIDEFSGLLSPLNCSE